MVWCCRSANFAACDTRLLLLLALPTVYCSLSAPCVAVSVAANPAGSRFLACRQLGLPLPAGLGLKTGAAQGGAAAST